MAIKGVSIPICAEYSHDGNGAVTYSNAYIADSAVEYSIEVSASEDNNLYADNEIKETSSGTFAGGTLSLTTADIPPALAVKMLGIKRMTRTVGGKEVKEVVYDETAKAPDLGFGIIEEHQIDGVTLYLPIVLTRVRFSNPGRAAKTRGKDVEWQTSAITAAIMRSDQVDDKCVHPWQFSPEEMYVTENDAKSYILAVLGDLSVAANAEE